MVLARHQIAQGMHRPVLPRSGRKQGVRTKAPITVASIGSVVPRLPSAFAQARTFAGLTTITERLGADLADSATYS